ncbi:hypothetical protein SH2C18_14420 [Clostridium sediminicola]|uniref:hypothetical protein n=1 Tax=Clostridium sediminicola TaxID=3114879 RepID=UPI0031F1C7F9
MGGCLTLVKAVGVQDHFGEVAKMPYLKQKYHMTTVKIRNRSLILNTLRKNGALSR